MGQMVIWSSGSEPQKFGVNEARHGWSFGKSKDFRDNFINFGTSNDLTWCQAEHLLPKSTFRAENTSVPKLLLSNIDGSKVLMLVRWIAIYGHLCTSLSTRNSELWILMSYFLMCFSRFLQIVTVSLFDSLFDIISDIIFQVKIFDNPTKFIKLRMQF